LLLLLLAAHRMLHLQQQHVSLLLLLLLPLSCLLAMQLLTPAHPMQLQQLQQQ
jgi:hypothetical protein